MFSGTSVTVLIILLVLLLLPPSLPFQLPPPSLSSSRISSSSSPNRPSNSPPSPSPSPSSPSPDDLLASARALRESAASLESTLPRSDPLASPPPPPAPPRVLLLGANGRLGSRVARALLRTYPLKSLTCGVHDARRSNTLSYEVGAEDGRGSLGAAWSEDREATFEFDPAMANYNLDKALVTEVELLSPSSCAAAVSGADVVVFVATDFDGATPRSLRPQLDLGLLFRAVRDPLKGRVEIEGVRNVLESFQAELRRRPEEKGRRANFVLVSSAPGAVGDFVTPLGDFEKLKREGEALTLSTEFPDVDPVVLSFSKFDENMVEEGLPLRVSEEPAPEGGERMRRINRRDAAGAVVEALEQKEWVGKRVYVHTKIKGEVTA